MSIIRYPGCPLGLPVIVWERGVLLENFEEAFYSTFIVECPTTDSSASVRTSPWPPRYSAAEHQALEVNSYQTEDIRALLSEGEWSRELR